MLNIEYTHGRGWTIRGEAQGLAFRFVVSPSGKVTEQDARVINQPPGPTIHPAARCGSCGDDTQGID